MVRGGKDCPTFSLFFVLAQQKGGIKIRMEYMHDENKRAEIVSVCKNQSQFDTHSVTLTT